MTDLNDLLHSFTLTEYHNEQLWEKLHQIWGDNYWEKTPSFSVNCETARSSTSLRNQSVQSSIRESNQTGLQRNRASVKSTGKSDVIRLTAPNSGMCQVLGSSVQEAASATLKHAAHLTKSVTRKESRAINHFIWKGCQRELTITPYRWLLPRINRVQERTKLATNGKTIWRIRGT